MQYNQEETEREGEVRTELAESEHEEGPAIEGAKDPREAEVRTQRRLTQVRGPTKAGRQQHETSHTPYRSWCEACVKATELANII